MSIEDRSANPPPPPETERRIRLRPLQWVGVPLVLVLPVVLGALGVFGESWDTAHASSSTVSATVHWPTRFRYKQLNEIQVRVENRTAAPIDTVTIVVDTTYLSRFSTVRGVPALDEPYRLHLLDVRPAEPRLAIIELQAERYGRHRGLLSIIAGDTARVPLWTTIFP